MQNTAQRLLGFSPQRKQHKKFSSNWKRAVKTRLTQLSGKALNRYDHACEIYVEAHRHEIIASAAWLDTWLYPIARKVSKSAFIRKHKLLAGFLGTVAVLLCMCLSCIPFLVCRQEEVLVLLGLSAAGASAVMSLVLGMVAALGGKRPYIEVAMEEFDIAVAPEDSLYAMDIS